MSSKVVRKVLTAAVVVAAASALWGRAGGASIMAAEVNPSLTVIMPAVDLTVSSVWTAQEDGQFAKQHVNVIIKHVGGFNVLSELLSGRGDLAAQGVASPMIAAKDGRDIVSLYEIMSGNGSAFVVGIPKIHSLRDCTRVTTTKFGTNSYGWTVLLQRLLGTHFSIITQDESVQRAALAAGTVDCGVANYSIYGPLVAADRVHILLDPRIKSTLPQGWPDRVVGAVYFGLRPQLEAKRPAIERFVRALHDTSISRYQNGNPDQTIAILQKHDDWKPFPAQDLVDVLKITRGFTSDGYLHETEWPETLRFLVSSGYDFVNTTDPMWSYSRRVDMSYYRHAILGSSK